MVRCSSRLMLKMIAAAWIVVMIIGPRFITIQGPAPAIIPINARIPVPIINGSQAWRSAGDGSSVLLIVKIR